MRFFLTNNFLKMKKLVYLLLLSAILMLCVAPAFAQKKKAPTGRTPRVTLSFEAAKAEVETNMKRLDATKAAAAKIQQDITDVVLSKKMLDFEDSIIVCWDKCLLAGGTWITKPDGTKECALKNAKKVPTVKFPCTDSQGALDIPYSSGVYDDCGGGVDAKIDPCLVAIGKSWLAAVLAPTSSANVYAGQGVANDCFGVSGKYGNDVDCGTLANYYVDNWDTYYAYNSYADGVGCGDAKIINYNPTTKSGPQYHLKGISGGIKYELDIIADDLSKFVHILANLRSTTKWSRVNNTYYLTDATLGRVAILATDGDVTAPGTLFLDNHDDFSIVSSGVHIATAVAGNSSNFIYYTLLGSISNRKHSFSLQTYKQ
jgi:hypothetical protein